MMKNGAVTVPSRCISWNFLPLASTSISTGWKKPGMLDEASSTSRNSLSALSSPLLGDRAHVPDHPTAGVLIGGHHEEAATLGVLGGDRGEHLAVTRFSISA